MEVVWRFNDNSDDFDGRMAKRVNFVCSNVSVKGRKDGAMEVNDEVTSASKRGMDTII